LKILLPGAIDLMTEGNLYLQNTFGVNVSIGYQIDPFGHSSLTPTLFSAMGYNNLVGNQ
jgi:hypothetical protein